MTEIYQYKVLKNCSYNGKKYYFGQEISSTEYITDAENFFLVKSLLKAVNDNTINKIGK
jgi:YHS domain-containing protein